MKTGVVLKNKQSDVLEHELELINSYSRKTLTSEQVYVFSVVLCDNDVDRDNERFTVESLFELEKLFVGKSGIMDHNMKVKNQTARIISCKVEALDNKKTVTGDDYFRLVARAYIPICEKTRDVIDSIDSGIIKEVSVGCAVKNTLCSICKNDINSSMCHHTKGHIYSNQMCIGELCDPYDAYEFSFVAVPAQKNAGVIKTFNKKEENYSMKDLLEKLSQGEDVTVKAYQTKQLREYIETLKSQAQDAQLYREDMRESVRKYLTISQPNFSLETINAIVSALSVKQLREIDTIAKTNINKADCQLGYTDKQTSVDNTNKNTQFTI